MKHIWITYAVATIFIGIELGLFVGCGTNTPIPTQITTIDTACQWAAPIQVSASDTVATKRRALTAWSTWNKNCPAKK